MSIDDIYGKPGHLIRRAQQISSALFAEECADHDITSVQYAALVAIREQPGIDATRLSSVIAFDRSTLGDVLERLEAKALIWRQSETHDRRIKRIHLTSAGQELIKAAAANVERVQQRLLAPLPPKDQLTLMRLLTDLVNLHSEAPRETR